MYQVLVATSAFHRGRAWHDILGQERNRFSSKYVQAVSAEAEPLMRRAKTTKEALERNKRQTSLSSLTDDLEDGGKEKRRDRINLVGNHAE